MSLYLLRNSTVIPIYCGKAYTSLPFCLLEMFNFVVGAQDVRYFTRISPPLFAVDLTLYDPVFSLSILKLSQSNRESKASSIGDV